MSLDRQSIESRPACRRCEWVMQGVPVVSRDPFGCFDVVLAERIVAESPRPLVTITNRALRRYVTREDVSLRHVSHVDRSRPGIMAQISHVLGHRRVLIEGHHRSFGALLNGEDFRVYIGRVSWPDALARLARRVRVGDRVLLSGYQFERTNKRSTGSNWK